MTFVVISPWRIFMRSKCLMCLVCLVLAGLAYGQAAPPVPRPAETKPGGTVGPAVPAKAPEVKAPEVKVGPDDPVITLKGFCADATLQGDACKTVITARSLTSSPMRCSPQCRWPFAANSQPPIRAC